MIFFRREENINVVGHSIIFFQEQFSGTLRICEVSNVHQAKNNDAQTNEREREGKRKEKRFLHDR